MEGKKDPLYVSSGLDAGDVLLCKCYPGAFTKDSVLLKIYCCEITSELSGSSALYPCTVHFNVFATMIEYALFNKS